MAKIKARSQPKGMPKKRWTQLKDRAEKERMKAGTAGEGVRKYNQALGFYVDRWKGKAVNMPKGMTSPSKRYQRVGKIGKHISLRTSPKKYKKQMKKKK